MSTPKKKRKQRNKFQTSDTIRGALVRGLRSRHGKNQEQLAHSLSRLITELEGVAVEITQQRVSAIERGSAMSPTELFAIVQYFDIDIYTFKITREMLEEERRGKE